MKFWIGLLMVGGVQVCTSTKCMRPDSFAEFNLPAAGVPFSGTLHLSGDDITSGSVEMSGNLDMKVANNSEDSTTAVIDINSLDLSGLNFVFQDELFAPFGIESLETCSGCSVRARLPSKELPVCPFKTNLILLLDGDLTDPSGHAVTFIAKTVSDSLELGFNASEASLVGYGQPGPEKTVTFTDEKNNRQIRQAINNYTVLNASGKEIPEGLKLVNEIFLTEARPKGQNVLVFVTDGFNSGKVNPAELASELSTLRKQKDLKIVIVAVAGDVEVYRKILGCKGSHTCPELIIMEDVSRDSAEKAAAEASALICVMPSKKDVNLVDPHSATLLTFTVKDNENLSTPSLESVANALIREAANEYRVAENKFEVVGVERNANRHLMGRQLSTGSPGGVLRIAMLNEHLNTEPQAIAQSLGQKLSQRGSMFAEKLRQQTGAEVLLQDFEIRNIAPGSSLRNAFPDMLRIENILQGDAASNILSLGGLL